MAGYDDTALGRSPWKLLGGGTKNLGLGWRRDTQIERMRMKESEVESQYVQRQRRGNA